jgi:hypothetical protein
MSTPYEIRTWLERAFCEPFGRINEAYYFDRRNNEFFSVFITDYFLTDPGSTEEFPNSPYSQEELATLSQRIDRLEDNSSFIISIPRLTIQERKEIMQLFIDKQGFSQKNEIDAAIAGQNERTAFDFVGLLPTEQIEKWQQFKFNQIQMKIETFCNLNHIDLDNTTLWTDEKMTSTTFRIRNTLGSDNKKLKKPWWQFWK